MPFRRALNGLHSLSFRAGCFLHFGAALHLHAMAMRLRAIDPKHVLDSTFCTALGATAAALLGLHNPFSWLVLGLAALHIVLTFLLADVKMPKWLRVTLAGVEPSLNDLSEVEKVIPYVRQAAVGAGAPASVVELLDRVDSILRDVAAAQQAANVAALPKMPIVVAPTAAVPPATLA